jgi:hypothetical protein
MGTLGILGGIGAGIQSGLTQNAHALREKQEQSLRDLQLKQAKDDYDYRQSQKAIGAGIGDDTEGIKARARSGTNAGRTAAIDSQNQSNADAAMGDDMNRAIDTSSIDPSTKGILKQIAQTDVLASPLNTARGHGQDVLFGAPVGITAGTPDQPTGMPAKGIRPVPASEPSGLSGGAPALDDQSAQSLATRQMFLKLAQHAAKSGRPEDVERFTNMSNSTEMHNYERMWRQTMQVLGTGNDQAAATAIAQLYNLGFPDGKYADVKALGNGQFKVVQYTDDGKMLDGKVIGRKDLMQLGENTLNPAERVKLWIAQQHDERAMQVSENGLRRTELQGELREKSRTKDRDAADARLEKALTSKQEIVKTQEAGKNDRQGVAEAGKDSRLETTEAGKDGRVGNKTDAKADAAREKALKQIRDEVARKANGLKDDNLRDAQDAAVASVGDGADPASINVAAAVKAGVDKIRARNDAEAKATNRHLEPILTEASVLPGKPNAEQIIQRQAKSNPLVANAYKNAKAMRQDGSFDIINYKKAYQQALREQGSAAPAKDDPLGMRR